MPEAEQLSVRDHMTLRLASQRFRYPAVRATRALETLGYTESRFWQRVDWLLAQPAAMRAYPLEVNRLSRLRDGRQAQRARRTA